MRGQGYAYAATLLLGLSVACSKSGGDDGSASNAGATATTPNRPATIPVPPGEDPDTFATGTGSATPAGDCHVRCDTITVRLAPSDAPSDGGADASADAGSESNASACPPTEDAVEAVPESTGLPYCEVTPQPPTLTRGECAYRVRLCVECCA